MRARMASARRRTFNRWGAPFARESPGRLLIPTTTAGLGTEAGAGGGASGKTRRGSDARAGGSGTSAVLSIAIRPADAKQLPKYHDQSHQHHARPCHQHGARKPW